MESKSVSLTSSSRRHTMYGEPNSTRNSMDLIEGTTQHYQGLKKPDAHIQRQRWDAFFEPQYSFGAFIHGLNQQEEEDQFIQHQKKIDRLVDDGNQLRDVKLERPSLDVYDTENSTATMTPTLPDLEQTTEIWGPKDETALIERLELLKKMRAQPMDHVESEGDPQQQNQQEQEANTARWKRNISEKAKQFCKETQEDNASILSSLDPDDEKKPVGENEDLEEGLGVKKFGCRRSFLCFLFGFLFPPLWLFGAFYFSSHANRQSSASRRIDRIWRRRSRIAFGIFVISLMIVLVVVFVLNPDSIGWRQSKLTSPSS